MIPECLSQINCPIKLSIDSLERRRLGQDLMQTDKVQNNGDSSISELFKSSYTVSKGKGFKLAKVTSHLEVSKYCYHNFATDTCLFACLSIMIK